MLTQERLKELLRYDPDTGLFHWIKSRRGVRGWRPFAGSVMQNGYVQITIDYQVFLAHRLAFLYMDGALPSDEVDHINGNPTDNRFSNLRRADRSLNMQNRRAGWGKLGLAMGVSKSRKKFRATIVASGVQHHLGMFSTAEEARNAYIEAKRQLHEGCTI